MTQSNANSPIKSISPLRQRMIEDMSLRKLKPLTQEAYLRSAIKLSQFLGHSPHTATAEDLRRFQLHLATQGASNITINATITGLRFLFEVTLGEPDRLRKMSAVHDPRKIPEILSPEQVARLLDATTSLKYKAALSTAYGAGLRASEVTRSPISIVSACSFTSNRARATKTAMLCCHR
jgi:integrase/recombinase XerD